MEEREVSIATTSVQFCYRQKLPDSSESNLVAVAMRHSSYHQKQTYDHRTSSQGTDKGNDFTSRTFRKALEDTEACDDDNIDSDNEVPINIVPGEIVALMAGYSTKQNPHVLFGKVISVNKTTQRALLNELVEKKPNIFKLRIAATRWEEKLSSLVHGIDFHYSQDDGGYVLRTAIEDIVDSFYDTESNLFDQHLI